ncbi:MAG: lytic transglycosylase domain-containing protein, partial [Parvularculaceae bacterium]
LARQAPGEPEALRNPTAWWAERQLLMRWALKERLYADAYAMASGHGLNVGNEFADAEFASGWIALRFLNAPERAETHFRALANSVGAPISVARAYYWLGRAADARGLDALGRERYARAAQFIYTYYGQLAAEKVGAPLAAQTFAPPVTPTPEESARFTSRPLVAVLKMLADLEADREFLVFAYQLDDELETPGEYVELARLADRRGATHIAVRAGKVGIGRNAFAAEVAYPLVFVPDEATRFAPAEIILGLSRQESEFNPRAYSSAGARGLMQLIPSTALATARKAGLRYSRTDLLDDPVYNMIIGSAHLKQLFDKYGGSRVMTFAAYNAGASRVEEWIERYGDPRASDVDPVDWVEHIPFAETRNYVQRVLENTQVYRGRLTAAPIAGKLAADLELGGPGNRVGALANTPYQFALPPLPERTARFASAAPSAPPPPPVEVGEPAGDPAAAEAAAPSSGAGGAAPANQDVSLGTEGLSDADKADFIGDKAQPPALLKIEPKPAKARSRKAPPKAPAAPVAAAKAAAPSEMSPAPAPIISGVDPAPAGTVPLLADVPIAPEDLAAPLTDEASLAPPMADAPSPGADCGAYRDFLAATAKEDATAADLNAGMLADFESGVCQGDSAAGPPATN